MVGYPDERGQVIQLERSLEVQSSSGASSADIMYHHFLSEQDLELEERSSVFS
jgi:hypothetical protein